MSFFLAYLRFIVLSAALMALGALMAYADLKERGRLLPKESEKK